MTLLDPALCRSGFTPRFEYRWFADRYGQRCWELDALSPVVLRARVEREIRSCLDLDAWEHAVGIEAAEVESMRSFLTDWKRNSRQAPKYSGGNK